MKMRLGSWLAGLLVLCATGTAFAQDGKIKLGLRLGYALPTGKVGDISQNGATLDGGKLSDDISGQIPIWIDAGYMVLPSLMVGLYGQYGFVGTKNCPSGASCSAHDLRIGIQGQYHFMPEQSTDPWLGLGFGYESLGLSETVGGQSFDASINGWELLNLQGGVDFQVIPAFTVGPFLSFSLDQFSSEKSGSQSLDFTTKHIHEWILIGAKGTFGI
jgi:outer membrane protein W